MRQASFDPFPILQASNKMKPWLSVLPCHNIVRSNQVTAFTGHLFITEKAVCLTVDLLPFTKYRTVGNLDNVIKSNGGIPRFLVQLQSVHYLYRRIYTRVPYEGKQRKDNLLTYRLIPTLHNNSHAEYSESLAVIARCPPCVNLARQDVATNVNENYFHS